LIKRELEQRGVDGDLIDNALEDYDSSDAAYRAVSRYAARQAGKDHAAFDRRVSGHLARRGFEYSIIRKTLDRLREELRISDPTRQG
jgi:regulatory protein